jgi:hypothetical protein
MLSPEDAFINARNLAVDILRAERIKTPELIQQMAAKAAEAQKLFAPSIEVDVQRLTAELRHLFRLESRPELRLTMLPITNRGCRQNARRSRGGSGIDT